MPTSSRVYVLRNLDTGSESSYSSLGEAVGAVDCMIDEGDAWIVVEIDSLGVLLPRSKSRASKKRRASLIATRRDPVSLRQLSQRERP